MEHYYVLCGSFDIWKQKQLLTTEQNIVSLQYYKKRVCIRTEMTWFSSSIDVLLTFTMNGVAGIGDIPGDLRLELGEVWGGNSGGMWWDRVYPPKQPFLQGNWHLPSKDHLLLWKISKPLWRLAALSMEEGFVGISTHHSRAFGEEQWGSTFSPPHASLQKQ